MKMIEYLYYGLLIVALVLFYFAYTNLISTQNLLRDGIKTTATVIDLIENRDSDGSTYKPVFEYTDKSGSVISFQSSVSSSPAPYKVGDKVKIIYSQIENEQKVISYWGLYRWTIILLSIAFPLLIIGGGYIWYTKG